MLTALALLAGAVALGAYPLVRRLTGRLERLRERVDELGAGDLSARVEVEGRDEVAALARSFNHAAERIERLVGAQQTFLASVSHELRTPLTRMRLATELQTQDDRPELRERIARDIEILDELIGELLLASRLDARAGIDARESVDLLALVAEETAAFGACVSGEPQNPIGRKIAPQLWPVWSCSLGTTAKTIGTSSHSCIRGIEQFGTQLIVTGGSGCAGSPTLHCKVPSNVIA